MSESESVAPEQAAPETAPAEQSAPEEAQEKESLETLRPIVEALIFAADQPVQPAKLAKILGRKIDARVVRHAVDSLNADYAAQGRAFEILEIAGGYQMLTRPEYKEWLAELYKERKPDKLSPSAVETLAIVAYRQPILRATVDDIRGVQTGPLLRNLLERGMIKVVGRQNVPGRPILYGTTRLFLQHFGLKSLKDLPKVADLTPP